tara:strand:+ start:46 stop:1941 length:1896 start_codon:yes stop_codon:yes gene_type:complete
LALTKIKTGGIADNAITNAKMADNAIDSIDIAAGSIDNAHLAGSIAVSKTLLAGGTGLTLSTNTLNVDAAQTQITSVGTLTSLASSGTISSSTSSTTDSALTLTDAGVADYKFTFPDTGTIRLSTSTSSDKTLDITNAGSGTFGLSVEGNSTFAGNITQSANANLRHTITAGGSGEASLVLTANNSTGDSFVRWETNANTFCMGLDNSDSNKFILSCGSDPHSNSVINIQPDGSSIAFDKPASFTDVITGKTNSHISYSSGNATTTATGGALNVPGSDIVTGRLFLQGYQNGANDLIGFNNETDQLVLYNYTDSAYIMKFAHNKNVEFMGGTTTFPVGGIIRFGERGNITHDNSNYNMSFNTNSVGNAVVITGTGMLQAKRGFTAGQALDIEGDTFGRTNSSNIALGIRQDGAGDLLVLQQSSNNVFTLDGEGRTYLYAHSNARTSLNVIASGSGQSPNDAKVYVEKNSDNDWSFMALAGSDDYGYKTKGTGSYAMAVENQSSNTYVFRVEYDGDILSANTSIASISDRRLKKEITNASSQWDDIKALNFVNYKWKKSTGMDDSIKYLGLVADEVESVSPSLIKIDAQSKEDIEAGVEDPEYKTVKYSIVWMKAVKALQEAMKRIEALENA